MAQLDTCGACQDDVLPAERPFNRPGLEAVSYRVGTHSSFFRRMLQRLATASVPLASDPTQLRTPPLAQLTTRSTDDPSIAMVDAWATVADVLSFYQERIANEGFLRTATERRSILELARAIGYELNPGVAANALLAFIVEDAAGAPGQATLQSGLKVLSIPGQNERPQTFETLESIDVRAEWNVLRPRATAPQVMTPDTSELFLRGIAQTLEPGDTLALIEAERRKSPASTRWDVRVVRSVEVVPPPADLSREGYTRVTWAPALGQSDRSTLTPADDFDVFVFRQRANLFGYNAPDFRAIPEDIKTAFDPERVRRRELTSADWPGLQIPDDSTQVDLDAVYPRILADSWALLVDANGSQLYHVDNVVPAARTDFTLSAKVTRLLLDTSSRLGAFGIRETLVLAQSERLQLADRPATTPVQGSTIALDRRVDGLTAGRRIVITGRPVETASSQAMLTEAATIEAIAEAGGRTRITLVSPLERRYDPSSVTVNANVVRATHGETVSNEVLGSGRGGTPNQRFSLRKPPLTYISASTPSGAASTLTLRVDGVEWQQTPSLFGLGPRDQSYTVRIQDNGQTDVIFGDGSTGARLPSGTENVVATYRSGIGPEGNVPAGRVSLLQIRPLGVRSVNNPLPASGAAAPENVDDARGNAPLTVLTLDRVVSLRDFEDFARAFAGVGKAQATRLWDGRAHRAHLTVAGVDGGPIDAVSTLPNLESAIDSVRDSEHEVQIQSYTPWDFGVGGDVLVDPRYQAPAVLAAAAAGLVEAFSFRRRGFGQPVSAAEVTTVLQSVPGVLAVSLTQLFFIRPAGVATTTPLPVAPAGSPPAFLPASLARWDGTQARPAELIVIDPLAISLSEMRAPT